MRKFKFKKKSIYLKKRYIERKKNSVLFDLAS